MSVEKIANSAEDVSISAKYPDIIWENTTQWTVDGLTGYQALCIAIKRAIDNNMPIWDPKYYTYIKQCDLEIIFKSDDGKTSIPLIRERVEILHQVGKVLLKKYQGSFKRFIELYKNNPFTLLVKIVNEFESYEDRVIYKNTTIIHKIDLCSKAWTLVSDIWFCFKGHELGFDYNPNLMKSTIFADHRISQVLLHFKILKYSEKLMTKLKNNEPLEHGSPEEIEIRSCSLHTVKLLEQAISKDCEEFMKKKGIERKIDYQILIDNFLWDYRHAHDQLLMETQPFPNIKCVYY
ncbi:queuosine salvage protein-like isoform X2 [Cataglyphis hispanica]|uniref:queuosine salvage protein-like isoform X2 n=1 Tax=Cataglyphis hispanica TaxID=1086592 RepID=UPI0021803389|nr:queuosine salvage protein-like isoform X2 [Cataglyphis hispanica]